MQSHAIGVQGSPMSLLKQITTFSMWIGKIIAVALPRQNVKFKICLYNNFADTLLGEFQLLKLHMNFDCTDRNSLTEVKQTINVKY